jgi:DNA polymerase IV
VAPLSSTKQVSAETTFDTDLTTMAAVHDAIARIAESAHRRLLSSGRAARTVTVKIRSADFTTHTRSETAAYATTNRTTLTAVAQRLARGAVPEGGVRLIGVSLAGLGDEPPPVLFDDAAPADDVVTSDNGDGAAHGDETGATSAAHGSAAPAADDGHPAATGTSAAPDRGWRAGDDVAHAEFGHGWVQGAGHGRVTVRFETRSTGPGRARTLTADDPALRPADPLGSLA